MGKRQTAVLKAQIAKLKEHDTASVREVARLREQLRIQREQSQAALEQIQEILGAILVKLCESYGSIELEDIDLKKAADLEITTKEGKTVYSIKTESQRSETGACDQE